MTAAAWIGYLGLAIGWSASLALYLRERDRNRNARLRLESYIELTRLVLRAAPDATINQSSVLSMFAEIEHDLGVKS